MPEEEKTDKDLMRLLMPFMEHKKVYPVRSSGSVGIHPIKLAGVLSLTNGHQHSVEDGQISENQEIVGESTEEDGHRHPLKGDVRNPQVEAVLDGRGVLHTHVINVPINRPLMDLQ